MDILNTKHGIEISDRLGSILTADAEIGAPRDEKFFLRVTSFLRDEAGLYEICKLRADYDPALLIGNPEEVIYYASCVLKDLLLEMKEK